MLYCKSKNCNRIISWHVCNWTSGILQISVGTFSISQQFDLNSDACMAGLSMKFITLIWGLALSLLYLAEECYMQQKRKRRQFVIMVKNISIILTSCTIIFCIRKILTSVVYLAMALFRSRFLNEYYWWRLLQSAWTF